MLEKDSSLEKLASLSYFSIIVNFLRLVLIDNSLNLAITFIMIILSLIDRSSLTNANQNILAYLSLIVVIYLIGFALLINIELIIFCMTREEETSKIKNIDIVNFLRLVLIDNPWNLVIIFTMTILSLVNRFNANQNILVYLSLIVVIPLIGFALVKNIERFCMTREEEISKIKNLETIQDNQIYVLLAFTFYIIISSLIFFVILFDFSRHNNSNLYILFFTMWFLINFGIVFAIKIKSIVF